MVEHLIFLLYLALFIVSCFGYGLIFSNLFDKEFLKLNPGYIGVIGIFFSIFISAISSFFFPQVPTSTTRRAPVSSTSRRMNAPCSGGTCIWLPRRVAVSTRSSRSTSGSRV